jgi:hypothetical protein
MGNKNMQANPFVNLLVVMRFCKVIALLSVLTLSACFQPAPLKWEESVILPDGRIVVLHRVQDFDEYDHVAAHSFEFEHPTTKRSISWQSDGFFRLVGLFIVDEAPYIVVRPTFGSHQEQAGCPYPLMFIFRFNGKDWQQIPYARSPIRVVTNNTTMDPKSEREHIRSSNYRLGAGEIKVLNDPVRLEYQGLNLDMFPKQVFQCPERKHFDFQ